MSYSHVVLHRSKCQKENSFWNLHEWFPMINTQILRLKSSTLAVVCSFPQTVVKTNSSGSENSLPSVQNHRINSTIKVKNTLLSQFIYETKFQLKTLIGWESSSTLGEYPKSKDGSMRLRQWYAWRDHIEGISVMFMVRFTKYQETTTLTSKQLTSKSSYPSSERSGTTLRKSLAGNWGKLSSQSGRSATAGQLWVFGVPNTRKMCNNWSLVLPPGNRGRPVAISNRKKNL